MSDTIQQAWYPVHFDDEKIVAKHGDFISIEEDTHVEVIDRCADQMQELVELIHDCPQSLKDEATKWIYYPWRHCVVRVLGANGFKRLRTDRNRNKITGTEQEVLASKTIAVVGLSVGHAVAYALAQEGLCGTLRLADHDELSLSNLNRIPADVFDIGLPKTVILARRIAELDPYLKVEIIPQGLTEETIDTVFDGVDMVVDECDSIDIKFAMRFKAKELGIPILMQTSDGGVLDIERFDVEPERPVFHGLTTVGDLEQLSGLSNADKVPMVMGILESNKVSARLAASLIEIDERVTTWPQLASDICLGAGMVGAAVRCWGLGLPLNSGRLRMDLDQAILGIQSPVAPENATNVEPSDPCPETFEEEIVHAASRAPSGGNVQPWRFSVDQGRFSAFVDPERSSLMDIKMRGSLLAVGAAVFNAEVKSAAAGRGGSLALCEPALTAAQRQGLQPVAEFAFGQQRDLQLGSLAEFVDKRASTRLRGQSTALNNAWMAQTQVHAINDGAEAVFLQGQKLQRAAEIWAEADRLRFLTPKLHQEMMSELSFPGDDLRRGIDVRTLELTEKDQVALNIAKRGDAMQELARWGGGKRLGEGSRNLIRDADALLVLTAAGSADRDYLNAGRLLERIWLEAARDEVGLHPMSPLFLYATSPSDLVGRLEAGDVQKMWKLRVELAALCGFEAEQPLALTMRATSVTDVSVRSQRESLADRLIKTNTLRTAEFAV